jgi:hypothetical protein
LPWYPWESGTAEPHGDTTDAKWPRFSQNSPTEVDLAAAAEARAQALWAPRLAVARRCAIRTSSPAPDWPTRQACTGRITQRSSGRRLGRKHPPEAVLGELAASTESAKTAVAQSEFVRTAYNTHVLVLRSLRFSNGATTVARGGPKVGPWV